MVLMYKMQNLSHQTFAFYTCSLSRFRTFAFYNFPSGSQTLTISFYVILSSRLSRAVIVVQTNPAHIVRITISLFLTYLLEPIPSDVQLFIQAAHAVF